MINWKKLILKTIRIIIFNETIRIEDFDFNKILLDEKSHGNILVYFIKNVDCCKTIAY